MSSDLYRDILKDRNQLDQSNPRTRSLGGLTSSDYQYKNFLSGMKVRGNSFTSNNESNRQTSSFVDSAARTTVGGKLNLKGDIEHDDEKLKAHKARYAELSHVPSKRSSDTLSPTSPLRSSSGIELGSSSKVQTESLGSVGMLRSLFDKHPDENKPRLRTSAIGRKPERPLSTGFDFDKKSKVSGVYEKQSIQEKRKSVDADFLTKSADKKIVNNVDNGPELLNKEENGYSSSEKEIEDDVQTGNKIDVSSILAPDEETDTKDGDEEEEDRSGVTSKQIDNDLQKKLEVERLKRTHEEVVIEKRFNVKRRSLKERLSLLASDDDPYGGFQTSDTFYSVDNSPKQTDNHDVFVKDSTDLPKEETMTDDIALTQEEPVKEVDGTAELPSYKSAVERFDEFITKEEIVPDSSAPGDSNTDINDNIVKLKDGVALEDHSSTDMSGNELGNEDENLMDSILQHMEKIDSSEYISLLRNESFSEGDPPSDATKLNDKAIVNELVKETTETPVLERPAVLPRLSKQQGYNQVLPSPTREEEKVLVGKNHVNTLPTLSEGSTASASSKSNTENESTDTGSNDEFPSEPQAKKFPPKSNLKLKPREEKRKVVFKTKNLQQVGFTYGKFEYNRANIDIDPIASSAEWELEKRVENMDIFSIDLHKDERGLGLSIIGLGVGTESGVEKLGIFVKTLTDKGAAQKDGRIQVNDQILEVNGTSLVGVTQYFAAQTLKGTNGVVKFLMGREKSRHTHLAPGAPIQLQPDMQQHIEEMNKMLAQLDEAEERAVNAEHTLEDVKRELLKAEERAHGAEQQLVETKEQLKVVTESPFIGNQRKMKNEIKKRGGKQEKVEELQRNLKNVTNRLSASEENLLQLTSITDEKDKEMEALQQKVNESDALLQQLKEANNKLLVEITNKDAELQKVRSDSEETKRQLEDQVKGFDEAKMIQEKEHSEKIKLAVEKERELTFKVVASENQAHELKENLLEAERKLKQKDEMSIDIDEYNRAQQKIKELTDSLKTSEDKVEQLEKTSNSKDKEICKLQEKINYLQSLILKLDKSSTEDEEKSYKLENDELKKKISQLEGDLDNKKRKYFQEVVNEDITITPQVELESTPDIQVSGLPELPKRINANSDETYPPFISRDHKPLVEGVEENHDTISSEQVAVDEVVVITASPPNPVPKPPRGHFIDTEEEEFVIVDKIEHTDNQSGKLKPNLSLDLTSISSHTDTENDREKKEILLDNSCLVQGVSDSIIIAAVAEASTPEREKPLVDMQMKYLQQSPRHFEEELPKQESGIDVQLDGEVEGDLGEFQLIAEDVQEEQSTPDTFVARKSVSKDKENRSSFFEALTKEPGFNSWLDEEWKRLDSQDREEQAEKIAAQVTAKSPTKKRISRTSSSSSEDEEAGDELDTPHSKEQSTKPSWKKQSIQIDSSYFQKSPQKESFDHGVSILDEDAVEKDVTVVKSLSFDSVIPQTAVLDNQVALTKREIVKKHEKRKPTQGARGSLAGVADDFQISTLPRKKTAQSTPNLVSTGAISTPDLIQTSTSSSSIEKPEKQKHKFGFHLPKVFKKGKLNKKPSFDEKTQPVITTDVRAPSSPASTNSNDSKNPSDVGVPTVVVSLESGNHSSHLSPPNDAEVVPIDEKTEAIKQQQANDAGTEEAVVPFADKEMLMDKAMKEMDEEVHQGDKNNSPSLLAHIEVENSDNAENKTTSLDDVEIELSSPSHAIPEPTPSENNSVSSDLPSDGNNQSYNERAIDVGNSNEHEGEEEITHWTRRAPSDWDVRQVGLWLVEMNLSQYVNNFKSHNVDGQALLRADGNRLKDYGVSNYDHRAEIKKRIKEFRQKLSKDSFNKGKMKDHKSTKDKLQFWKGKYKVPH